MAQGGPGVRQRQREEEALLVVQREPKQGQPVRLCCWLLHPGTKVSKGDYTLL